MRRTMRPTQIEEDEIWRETHSVAGLDLGRLTT